MGTLWELQPSVSALLRQGSAAVLLLLAGCDRVERFYSSKLTPDTPTEWWHQLEGGAIADQRPPPPGITDPYPNLGQLPPRPTTLPDQATRRALMARLAAERDRAQREAKQDPIGTVPAPGAAPAAAVRAAPPADPGASTAVMEAASAPPAPPNLTRAAAPPTAASPAAATPAAAPPPAPSGAPPAAITTTAAAGGAARRPAAPASTDMPAGTPPAPVQSGPVPQIPAAAPPIPQLAGIPADTTAPATPRPTPLVRVAFRPGSATLPPSAEADLRSLAGRRTGAAIQITTGGDAHAATPDVQAAALPLALRRAQAIAAVLAAAGVPQAALRTDAVALARTSAAQLVN